MLQNNTNVSSYKCRGSEVQIRFQWLHSRCQVPAGLCSYSHSGGSRGESVVSPFPASRGCTHSLAYAPIHLHSPKWLVNSFSQYITLTLTLLPPTSPFRCPYDYTEPSQITQDNLFILSSIDYNLISTYYLNSPSPCDWTYSQAEGISTWMSCGDHYPAHHTRLKGFNSTE